MLRKYLALILGLLPFCSFAQIDDSTKQIYSNKTVQYIYEKDVIRNIKRDYNPDSTLKNYHYPSPVRRQNWLYQDLGSVGTASKSILFEKNLETGQDMGMNSFNLYAPNPENFKYYNTRSPYTYLGYLQGGSQTQFQVTHSQNINSRFNLTLNIFKFSSEKLFGYTRVGEVLANHWQYNIGTNYSSKNDKYKVLATFYHFQQKNAEQGGIKNGLNLPVDSIAKNYSNTYDAALTGNIFNRERWNNLHVYQQFLLKNSLQVFHILDFEKKFYSFIDNSFTSEQNAAVYGIAPVEQIDTLAFHGRFTSLSNKFGFKGIYRGVNYQAYIKNRLFTLKNPTFEDYNQKLSSEIYIGGLLGYVFKDSTNTLDIKTELSSDQNYLFDANLFYKGFEIGFYNAAKPVGLFFQKFDNGVLNFNKINSYKSTNSKAIDVKFPLALRNFRIVPQAKWASIANHVYIDEKLKPQQLDSDINTYSVGANLGLTSNHWNINYLVLFNHSNNQQIYPIPAHIHHANIEYNFLYAKVLNIFLGTDIYYKSKYKANSFSPLLNQFYTKNYEVGGVPIMDLYIKFPLSKGRFSLNYTFVNKLFMSPKGHFTSPGYLGQPQALMIKIDWPLFD